ncbi:MAG TPA: membrane protein insertion efficiency factor YidD [Cytophagaceae bacterium]
MILRNSVLLLLLCLITFGTYAQSAEIDLQLIEGTSVSEPQEVKKKYKRQGGGYVVIHSLFTFYQKVISPQLSADCQYEISCSRFGRSLFEEYSLLKAFFLTADRLSRCNRIAASDVPAFRRNEAGKIIDHVHYYR